MNQRNSCCKPFLEILRIYIPLFEERNLINNILNPFYIYVELIPTRRKRNLKHMYTRVQINYFKIKCDKGASFQVYLQYIY